MTDLDSTYLSAILEQSNDGYIFTDTDGIITRVNPAMLKILGISKDELVGEHIQVIVDIIAKYAPQKELLEFFGDSETQYTKLRWRNLNWDITKFNFEKQTKSVICIKKNTDDELSQYIRYFAFDVKNAISSAHGYSNILFSDVSISMNEKQTSAMQTIISSSFDRFYEAVEKFRDFAIMKTGEFKGYGFEQISLSEIIIAIKNRREYISIEINLDENLPPIFANQHALKSLLDDLITRAYNSKPKSIKVNIFQDNNNTILIGIGKYTGFSAFLFEDDFDFYRAKNVIEAHNGEIWFESEEGVGTTFFIRLPIKQDETE